jgi:HAD superfamily hydrolase (TIGR01509 family)
LNDAPASVLPPRAIVFDMDGLLLDTERIALAAFEEVCNRRGVTIARDIYLRCVGTSVQGTREILAAQVGHAAYEGLSRDWFELYEARVTTRPVAVKDGAIELLAQARSKRIPMAVATSTAAELAKTKLRLAGLIEFFYTIVGGDAVTHCKPHPEPYLAAAAALGHAPNECWAIEDSDNGVRSAHAAGFRVVQVPDLVQPAEQVRRLGHVVVRSLHDVAGMLGESI